MSNVLNLDKRLSKIVELCSNTKIVADIGCDHGKVGAELILQSKAYGVIATDISPKSLNKAVRLASRLNISPYISFREGDGFSVISKYDKVDCAIVAGFGGSEMLKMIKQSKNRINELILQPMSDILKLRSYMLQIGFKITDDVTIKSSGKFYHIIKFKEGKMKITDLEFYFGITNVRELGEDFIEYLNSEKEKIHRIEENAGELSLKKQNYLNRIEIVLKKYEDKKDK